jgi:hypothetical protein
MPCSRYVGLLRLAEEDGQAACTARFRTPRSSLVQAQPLINGYQRHGCIVTPPATARTSATSTSVVAAIDVRVPSSRMRTIELAMTTSDTAAIGALLASLGVARAEPERERRRGEIGPTALLALFA